MSEEEQRVQIVWNEAADDLKRDVHGWADNIADAKDWVHELASQKIRSCRTLEERSESSRWQSTLDKLSDGLAAKLETWYKLKHPETVSSDSRSVLGKRPASTQINPHFPPFKKQKGKFAFESWPASSDFKEVRFSHIPYVDKSSLFQKLFGKRHVFLSRPRRFGKTLLVNTLKELFLGHRELFEDLDIDNTWDWTLNKYPVIKLDLSRILINEFPERLCSILIEEGEQYGLNFDKVRRSFPDIFDHIVSSLRILNSEGGRNASFVILIDEYDKPVIDALDSPDILSKNLNLLNSFLQLVKAASPAFSLVTGSSRLARAAIFSGDNIREDISFDPVFNSLCGFTEREIAQNLKLGNLTLQELKIWYSGYCFGGDQGVYNPFSIAKAIVHQAIDCYWVKSGTTKLLAELCGSVSMRDFFIKYVLSSGIQTDFSSLVQSEDVWTLGKSSESLQRLFLQSGYLTISLDPDNSDQCTLRAPNKEIQNYALPCLMIAGLAKISVSKCHAHFETLAEAVRSRNIENIYDSIMDLFQVIGFPDRGKIDKVEDYYQRILQAFFLAICPSVRTEERTSLGKSDVVADFNSWKILFELKVLVGEKSVTQGHPELDGTIQGAFLQAKEKYQRGLLPDVICVLVFNTSTRTLFPRDSMGVPFYEIMGH
eukprot:TRINITY_DN710_c0_g1_i9.p1 TRINITY_DN710_c0_g1~~TRINITY_DN710_c0_g1_i9.p1  ORF type:complete len:656 (-),score=153.26 TRINITY_DN710_c0_g1_i9:109-2076(-)